MNAWAKFSKPNQSDANSGVRVVDTPVSKESTSVDIHSSESGVGGSDQKLYETPAQQRVKSIIENCREQIIKLGELKNLGISTAENNRQLIESKQMLKINEQKIKNLIADSVRQRKRRAEKSAALKDLASQSKDASKKLKKFTHHSVGRPPAEDTFPELRNAIIQLATAWAGADGRRRTNILDACHTLDDLCAALNALGYTLSRQAIYYRLVPRRANSEHGKRHVRTVPVRIRRAKNNIRNRHEDADFTFATKGYLKNIASVFGNKAVFAVSVDDKAKVPIGITAAKSQAPLLMHMEYEIRLPDHDFVKASKHKLTPSVYAACKIKASSARSAPEISYSGPMYIAIRSLKHDSSTAFTHGRDFDHMLTLDEFKEEAFINGEVKPIVLAFVDGGPDENPRFPKVLSVAIDHFRKHNLDAYIAMTHAPGMSAYNYVERRMAPLSKAMVGILLPYDTFGNHLD